MLLFFGGLELRRRLRFNIRCLGQSLSVGISRGQGFHVDGPSYRQSMGHGFQTRFVQVEVERELDRHQVVVRGRSESQHPPRILVEIELKRKVGQHMMR